MIGKITHSVDYNYRLKRFETQLITPTNQKSIKAPKVVIKQTKRYYKTLGTSIICSPMSPPSLDKKRYAVFYLHNNSMLKNKIICVSTCHKHSGVL